MYDAIVVGARVAGAPTAMLLARKGHKVLLVDRATFPSDTVSTHFLTPEGVAKLDAWGLLERVRATGCPDIPKNTFNINGTAFSPPSDPSAPAYPGLCPRRTVLDKVLVDAASEAGVEVREGVSVREIVREGDRVVGIRGQTTSGEALDERATIVVGADGKDSFVARSVGAEKYNERPGTTCGYYSYFSNVEFDGAEIHILQNRALFLFPTNDGQVCLATERPREEFEGFKKDVEGNFMSGFGLVPDLYERAKKGERTEKFFGMLMPDSFYRKPFGAGWALVGDAGFHKDPILGQGITDAFRDAELLSDAIDAALSGRRPMDEALASYQQQRDAATAMLYEVTAQFATLNPPQPLVDMIAGMSPAPAA